MMAVASFKRPRPICPCDVTYSDRRCERGVGSGQRSHGHTECRYDVYIFRAWKGERAADWVAESRQARAGAAA